MYNANNAQVCVQFNQSIKYLYRQYTPRSQAQWHDRQISVQQQNRRTVP